MSIAVVVAVTATKCQYVWRESAMMEEQTWIMSCEHSLSLSFSFNFVEYNDVWIGGVQSQRGKDVCSVIIQRTASLTLIMM